MVVLLTAFSQRTLIESARDAGVAAYLVKPFRSSEILPKLAAILNPAASEPLLTHEVPSADDKIETREIVQRAKEVLMAERGMDEARGVRDHPAVRHASAHAHARRGPADPEGRVRWLKPTDQRPLVLLGRHVARLSRLLRSARRYPNLVGSGHQRPARLRVDVGLARRHPESPGAGRGLRPAGRHVSRRAHRGLQGRSGRDAAGDRAPVRPHPHHVRGPAHPRPRASSTSRPTTSWPRWRRGGATRRSRWWWCREIVTPSSSSRTPSSRFSTTAAASRTTRSTTRPGSSSAAASRRLATRCSPRCAVTRRTTCPAFRASARRPRRSCSRSTATSTISTLTSTP